MCDIICSWTTARQEEVKPSAFVGWLHHPRRRNGAEFSEQISSNAAKRKISQTRNKFTGIFTLAVVRNRRRQFFGRIEETFALSSYFTLGQPCRIFISFEDTEHLVSLQSVHPFQKSGFQAPQHQHRANLFILASGSARLRKFSSKSICYELSPEIKK